MFKRLNPEKLPSAEDIPLEGLVECFFLFDSFYFAGEASFKWWLVGEIGHWKEFGREMSLSAQRSINVEEPRE